MEERKGPFQRMKPFVAVIFLQFGLAGMDIICKAALNEGMSNYVLAVYRHAVATIVMAPFAIILDRPVIDQNLYFLGMKHTTATFAAAMCNILPAITFVMAWILRMEKVKLRSIRSQGKVVGTLATVAGAMIMTLAITLKTYPAELSLTSWICLLGTIEGSILAVIMERGKPSVWAIHWDTKLLAFVYSGVVCSGMAYYIQGIVMKERGPVFVTAFSPLVMVIVAVMGSFILAEQLFMGRVLGAIVIVGGLYLVVWGKSKENQSSKLIDEELTLPTDMKDTEGKGRKEFDQGVIMIHATEETINRG
ncbi:hypothetical protein SAY86_021260 [Trapa natans]|uniref:WAT1-related protein n=1 Tax=Trapa natans TaxID=22666 RepID=A0AAN7M1T4_TRANT|nr:hypothetical protein SAY86_021260 [Trapa natans]